MSATQRYAPPARWLHWLTVVLMSVVVVAGLWIAYAADEWLRGLLMWRRWRRLQWLPYARASRRRLRGDPPVPADTAAPSPPVATP